MEIAEPKIATNTRNKAPFIACAKSANFPIKPAVKGIPAIDNIEIAPTTANNGSEYAKPLKALKEVSLLSFSTQIRVIITPTVANA